MRTAGFFSTSGLTFPFPAPASCLCANTLALSSTNHSWMPNCGLRTTCHPHDTTVQVYARRGELDEHFFVEKPFARV